MARPLRKLRSIKTVAPSNPGQRVRGVSARGIKVMRARDTDKFYTMVGKRDVSNQIQDPFDDFYGFGNGNNILLTPPFNFDQLARVGEANSTLNQCIDSYVVNIEAYGYTLEYVGPNGKDKSPEAMAQKAKAESFLDAPNSENTLRDVRERTRKDEEYTGNKYYELFRNRGGEVLGFDWLPSTTMRLTRVDSDPTEYFTYIRNPELPEVWKKTKAQKQFRRYVQLSATGRRVYFKEFGDPRSIDPATGLENDDLAWEDQATEVYHRPIYTVGNPYGIPRWIGTLPSILGSRESELVNLDFFRENAIPAMAILISGGALTQESFDKISDIIQARRGKEAMNRILVLEAAADDSSASVDGSSPAPRIDMKPMISERQTDGHFQDFEKAATNKILSSMRLPPIYIGASTDYTKATAEAGQRMAEGQIFAPERTRFDDFVNFKIFPTKGIALWRFKSMGPTTYDPDSLATFIDKFSKNGALTPNVLITLANQTLDIQVPTIQEDWANVPFGIITTAIQYGYEIPSLDKYIKVIQEAATPPPSTPAKKPVAKGVIVPTSFIQRRELQRLVRSELSNVASDLTDMVEERLQLAQAA